MTSSKSTKRALISGALAILMCVAMLIGTTFAWFTDTASTAVNKIQAGNLNIELQMKDNDENWVNAEGKTLPFLVEGKIPAEGTQILWEPGCTYYVPEVRVLNKGNLAVKFEYLPEALGVSGKLAEVLELVFKAPVDTNGEEVNIEPEILKPGEASPAWSFGYHMDENAGNDYQNTTATGICVTVVATQATYEKDSIDDQYDKNASLDFVPVSTTDELKAVFANATDGEDINVSLAGDIDFGEEKTFMVVDEGSSVGDINIQANGYTIKNAATGARVMQIAKSDVARNITITGAKIVSEGATTGINAGENRGVQIFSVENATVNLVNCDIEMKADDWSYPVKIGGTSKNITVNITGCTLTGANCIENFGTSCTVNITDCVLNSNYVNPSSYGHGIKDNGTGNVYNVKNTAFNGTNAAMHSDTTDAVFNDLGGNADNTSR